MAVVIRTASDFSGFFGNVLRGTAAAILRPAAGPLEYLLRLLKWRAMAPGCAVLHRWAINRLSWWRLDWAETPTHWRAEPQRRIVYYLYAFPNLSETFIQREIAALLRAGMSVRVIAREVAHSDFLGEEARSLSKRTQYLQAPRRAELLRDAWDLLRERPLRFMNALLYVLCCRYERNKSLTRDLELMAAAIQLAAVLKQKGIHHVHAPWASTDAFVALLAARLLNIVYTVEARAYDIHRHSSAVGREVKLSHAAFVITNSTYNESALRLLLPPERAREIRVVYEGIALNQFEPPEDRRRGSKAKILSVGNLVEPKGLEYLLLACKILKQRGYAFECEIVGGPVTSETNYHIKLLKLHKALDVEEIVFSGRQPLEYVIARYREADIFVLPAVTATHGGRDITPNVLMEAMAMKLAVVSTQSGAIPEIVEDGISGILVPPRDESGLAQAIIRLLEDPPLAALLGANARKKIEERFDINKNIAEYVRLFSSGV